MKKKRHRVIDPQRAQEAALGEVSLRGFYQRLPEPAKITCSRCGEERNSVGQEDGVCLRCRWETRKAAREASA